MNHKFKFFIFMVLSCMVFVYGSVNLQDTSKNPDKYSAIVEADGYVFLSEEKSLRELREEAIAAAKREALERGQTFIQSCTRVENFQLVNDLIETESEGYVKILESKDHGITADNRYRYWIKAEIEYKIRTSDSQNQKIREDRSAPLFVKIWTDKNEYKEGERIQICVQGNKDFYARIIYIDARGNKLQLVPNRFRQDNLFPGGRVVAIPEQSDGFQLEVVPPFGQEQIYVYASTAPQGDIETSPVGKSLYQVIANLDKIGIQTRGVKIVPDRDGVSAAQFFETKCEIITK